MPLLAALFLCFAALFVPSHAQAAALERTLLYLGKSGALFQANISAREARLPEQSLLPGRKMERFVINPTGAQVLFETAGEDGAHSAWLLDLATRRVTALGSDLLLPSGDPNPFAPDGRRVALRRQEQEEVVVFSTTTGKALFTLPTPGIQEAPAWFGDSRHLAVVAHPPAGNTVLSLFDGLAGALQRQLLLDPLQATYQFAAPAGDGLIYREVTDSGSNYIAVQPTGETNPTEQPAAAKLPADLPEGVTASLSPDGGAWTAYLQGEELYIRYSVAGAQAVPLAPATAFQWKPGEPLPEKASASEPQPQSAPVHHPAPKAHATGAAPARVPGVITFRSLSSEAVEGEMLGLEWQTGAKVAYVKLSAYVERTPRGPMRRGAYAIDIAQVAARQGRFSWKVPWIDNIKFILRAEALSASRQALGRASRSLSFRPRQLADKRADGIYVHLSEPARQRLYLQKDGRLELVFLCSGSSSGKVLPLNEHPDAPHDHYGTFHITAKDVDHTSSLNDDWRMPYAMRYLAGHFIHVTGSRQYSRLGRPGSHGCVRLHRADGIRLFQLTPVGEMVVID